MLQEISKEDTFPSFRSLRFPKHQIFVEMLCANSQPPWYTNMAAGK